MGFSLSCFGSESASGLIVCLSLYDSKVCSVCLSML